MDTKHLILEVMKKTDIAVISTFGEVSPESAVVNFAETENFELIFDTFLYSRKSRNIQKNPNVSFAIGWNDKITIQYEGVVRKLEGDEVVTYKELFFRKCPYALRRVNEIDLTYFIVKPRWIRYTDLNQHPWDVKELNF